MPSITKNIFPQPDGRFWVRYRYGEAPECKKFFDTWAEARDYITDVRTLIRAHGQAALKLDSNKLARLMAAVDAVAPGNLTEGVRIIERLAYDYASRPVHEHQVVTVATAAQALFESWANQAPTPKEIRYHRTAKGVIQPFVDEFGHLEPRAITPAMVSGWVNKKSQGMRVTAKARVCRLFSFCAENGWIKLVDNPATGFKLKRREKRVVKVPTAGVIERYICMAMEPQYKNLRPYLAIRLFSGVRTDEAQALEWGHIDLARRRISLPQGVVSKEGRARIVPIAENLLAWLALDSGKTGRIAPEAVDTCELEFRAEFRRREGIEVGSEEFNILHNVLRHSCASYRALQVSNLDVLAAEMGNSRRILLSHYIASVSPEEAEAFWNILPPTDCAKRKEK